MLTQDNAGTPIEVTVNSKETQPAEKPGTNKTTITWSQLRVRDHTPPQLLTEWHHHGYQQRHKTGVDDWLENPTWGHSSVYSNANSSVDRQYML